MIYIFGDSITVGSPGISYCHYLNKEIRFKKYGLGGDTISGLLTRIKKINICSNDTFIIEIGTNDIMLPYLRSKSTQWEKTINGIENSGRVVTNSLNEFLDKYDQLLKLLINNKLAAISIPCIGENINSNLNHMVDDYNMEIKQLCDKYSKYFINFNNAQKNEIQKKQKLTNENYFITNNPINMIIDVFSTKFFSLSGHISKKRNLVTTVDGVHLNKIGAMLLAKSILPFVKNI
jgi:lysophospholipase L1-like esterase